jgi:hypothetical protein
MFPTVFRVERDKDDKDYKRRPSNPNKTIESDVIV